MKSKSMLFSVFAAFACVLASGFAWGETVILRHQGLPDRPFTNLQEAIDVAAPDDFVVLRSDVVRDITITNKTCLYVESCSIGSYGTNPKKGATFTIFGGGSLELRNDAASTNSSFCGQFDLKGGSLVLNGMTCYAAKDEPILKTGGVSNSVVIAASKFYSSESTVFQLEGDGMVSVKGKSVISCDSSATKYDPEVAIRLLRGDLVVDDSLLRAKTTCVFIGTEAYDAPTGDVSCRIVNGAELKSGWDCVCAVAGEVGTGKVNIEVHDSNLSARNDGVRLFSDVSSGIGSSKLTLDGATTITTAESDYAYAIENGAPGKWAVAIVSGMYYRMKKSISKDWISLSSEATWDPVGQDDGLRLTVINSGERKVEYVVSFDFSISGVASQTNSYRVPYGEGLNVADITPAKDFAVTNDYGIFAGWYYTKGDAKGFSNKVDVVSTSTNLVAGWKKAAATFHRSYDADDETTNYFGLAKYVNESAKKIDFGQLFPRQMGWDDPKYSFEEWQNDKGVECHVLPFPMISEDVQIYAEWLHKESNQVFKVDNAFYSSIDEAVKAAKGGQKPILLVENLDRGLSFGGNVTARLDLNGYSIGSATNELECAISVANGMLTVVNGKDGIVYGQIRLGDGARVVLEGGTFVCSSNSVVSAEGDGYTFVANGVEVSGGASGSGVLEFYGNTGNLACISNSVISGMSKDVDLSVGVTICGCDVELANAVVAAAGKGVEIISCCNPSALVDTTNALNIVAGSKITARYGVFAEPSSIYVQGSTVEAKDMGGYAFFLKDGKGGECELLLGTENDVIGGVLTDKGAVSGGLLRADVNWGGSIEIFGGTYAHVASNEFSSAWIAPGYEVKWLSPTCFTVDNPHPVPTDSIHIDFGTGVADPDSPEDPESEVEWNYESEEYPGPWPTIAEEYESGCDFPTNLTVHSLPSAAWGDRKFSGWEAYVIDYDDDDNPVTNRMGKVFVDTITLDELQSVSDDYDGILHAVWDRGGKPAGLDDFDHLYNEDPTDPVMSGGDTYVGAILDGEQTLGTVTVKCGVPNGKGEVSVTATVKTAEGGTVTFRGKGAYDGSTITVDLENGDHMLSLTLDSKSIQSGQYDNYDIRGGVNKFKGSQENKDEGDLRLKHWLGKWMIIFATEDAQDESYKKKVHGEWEDQDTGKENGSAHACGYSHVILDIKDKGLVSVSGKLANGKEVSSTATAIVGDNGVCVPVVCSIYSGYDWFALCNFVRNYGMRALVPAVTDNFRTTTNRGGFGFTAWFSNSETNLLELASENDSLIVNNVSLWDSSYVKSMPFTATVVPTNAQRVADIKLPEKMVFFVEKDTNSIGWLGNANDENVGDLTEGVYYIPSQTYDVPDNGYLQTVTVSASTNAAYSMKADGKAPRMKLVDADGTPYIVPSKNGSNFSALKLKYNQKNGVFTGSFKIYSLKTDLETDKTSLKATKVTVSGGIADGRGYGFSHSSAVGSQPVMLVPVGDATLSEPENDDEDREEDDEGDDDEPEEEPEEVE